MNMLLKLLREGLGRVIIAIDWITRPSPMQRSESAQQQVEQALQTMTLYQLYACPFCIKTRRALRRLNLPIEIRNVQSGSPYRQDLLEGGGRVQVPCLRIADQGEDMWMYESGDIIRYLEQRFG
jgi:glutaredoxin